MHVSGAISAGVRRINGYRRRALRLNFYRCHLAYFIITSLIVSGLLYGASTDAYQLSYADSIFLCVSAITDTGLNTVDLNSLSGYQQSILMVLMILGDLSTVSISVVVVRRIFFRKQISEWTQKHKSAQRVVEDIDQELALKKSRSGRSRQQDESSNALRPSTKSALRGPRPGADGSALQRQDYFDSHDTRHFGGFPAPWETQIFSNIVSGPSSWITNTHKRPRNYHFLSFEPKLDHKGRFRTLTSEEYEELGGVEYRALKLLCWILPVYTAFWILLPMIILAPYASAHEPVANTIRTSQPGNLNPAWWGVFTAVSSYTNCGLNPINASMMPFRSNWLILIVTGAAVVAGNTFYPIFLRIFIWIISKLVPKNSAVHHSLFFLLYHPRRCYLWLFDRKTTWILTGTQLGLILGEWVLFEILNINQTAVAAIPTGTRIMDGLYQSFGTRSSGFYIVQISSISPSLMIIYAVIMYFSVFPLIISLRSTNVYEERSVGLEADIYDSNVGSLSSKHKAKPPEGPSTGTHIRNQLAYDLWWIVLSWILIALIEEAQLNDDAPGYSPFAILFEVVSAYGNCGLTLGVPYDSYALCGTFHTLSKLILITVMLRGRHRILPMALDRSILLPGQGIMEEMDRHYNEPLQKRREHEAKIREAERGSQAERPDGQVDPNHGNDEEKELQA